MDRTTSDKLESAIENTRVIVTHENCADGIASALILKRAFPNARVEFVNYNTRKHAELPAEPGMLFCDVTPPRERIQEFIDAGAVVLDHHVGQKDIVDAFGDLGLYSDDPGVSGAVMAWGVCDAGGFANTSSSVQEFANLAGIYDTWRRQNPKWDAAVQQAESLLFFGYEYMSTLPHTIWLDATQSTGKVLVHNRNERVIRCLDQAEYSSIRGVKVCVFQGPSADANIAADKLRSYYQNDVDIVAAFTCLAGPEGRRYVVSLRSVRDISVLPIAKANGGGGHEKAAGFTYNIADACWYGDPWTIVLRTLANSIPVIINGGSAQ